MINVSMNKGEKGFTITELLVATAVFAGVLLLAIIGFIQVGRMFYKGVTVSQTRQTATNIMDAVSSDIRLSTGVGTPPGMQDSNGNGYTEYCIGSHLYTLHLDNQINLANENISNGQFGLVQSDLPGGACPSTSVTPAQIQKSNPVEMLGDGMRLSDLEICSGTCPTFSNPNPKTTPYSFQVIVTVSYGDSSVLNNPDNSNPPPSCKGISTGSQFCAVIQLNSTVSNRPSLGL